MRQKFYTIHCGNNYPDEVMRALAPIKHDTHRGVPTNLGTISSITVYTEYDRDFTLTLLHAYGIPIYGFRKVGLYERVYKEMNSEELAPLMTTFRVVKDSKGNKVIEEVYGDGKSHNYRHGRWTGKKDDPVRSNQANGRR